MKTIIELPLLPLRDVVVYPHMVIPLFVGREKSIAALEAAMEGDKKILLIAQQQPADNDPKLDALYTVGTVATILQLLKLPDGTVKVLAEGEQRGEIIEGLAGDDYLRAQVQLHNEEPASTTENEVLRHTLFEHFESFVQQSKKVPAEALATLGEIDDVGRLSDSIAAQMTLKLGQKQTVLDRLDIAERVDLLLGVLDTELELLNVEKRIRGRVKKQMERSQREYYLNEQMKAIQKELGEGEDGQNDMDVLKQRIDDAGMSEEALAKAHAELKKLQQMSPMSAEASVVRTYLDWLINTPWKAKSKVRLDLQRAEEILEADHFGLEEVKERILEYLAVQKRVKKLKGPILCLVGPPGVGKTSLAESIARSVNRKYIRMALGGVRDEA